jgi:hypothetical protein
MIQPPSIGFVTSDICQYCGANTRRRLVLALQYCQVKRILVYNVACIMEG